MVSEPFIKGDKIAYGYLIYSTDNQVVRILLRQYNKWGLFIHIYIYIYFQLITYSEQPINQY